MPKNKEKPVAPSQAVPGYRCTPVIFAERNHSTFNETDRSQEYVMTTEDPVPVYDYKRWEVIDEVLLMDGLVEIPDSVPLQDSHMYHSVVNLLGSADNIHVENDQLIGRAVYSKVKEADDAFTKVREGHLKTVSVGYLVYEAMYLEKDQTETIRGREFTGPIKVVTKWALKELSNTSMPADGKAVARSHPHLFSSNPLPEEPLMPKPATKKTAAGDPESRTAPVDPAPPAPVILEVVPATVTLTAEERQAIKDEAVREDRTRGLEIRNMFQTIGLADHADAVIATGVSAVDARAEAIKIIAKRNKEQTPNAPTGTPEVGLSSREKFSLAAQDAICMRAGHTVEKPAEGAGDLRGYSMRELAREYLRIQGLDYSGDAMTVIGRALTTSDYTNILGVAAHKALLMGFATEEETFETWCDRGEISDFKTLEISNVSEFEDLEEVLEGAEYKYGKTVDAKESIKLATYGKKFAITRQALINDDLSALNDTPIKMGRAARRKEGDVAYAVLIANAAMGDGKALFHADHNNLLDNEGLDVAKLGNSVTAMKLQKDLSGNATLNIRPIFFLAAVGAEVASEQFFKTITATTNANSNPYEGSYFTRVYEPRLDDADAAKYYLAAAKGKTVRVFNLTGNTTPRLESKPGWNVDGIEYKVSHEVAAKALDYRGLQNNTLSA